MRKIPLLAVLVSLTAYAPAYAADANKSKDWCTDAHMKQMDQMAGKMTDPAKQKEARTHLTMSKDAMEANNMAGCVKHMKEAHKAMGM
jgi:hypothetical protein